MELRNLVVTTLCLLSVQAAPFWILEDELMKRQRLHNADTDYVDFAERQRDLPSSISFVLRQSEQPTSLQRQLQLRLPQRYVPQTKRQAKSHKRAERRQPASLPIFDAAPGDNALPGAAASSAVFIYNGTRGELLLNTMLSAQRYPMQEPVPGQVLYPPATPMFRPKPMLQRYRQPKQAQAQALNLTLIPFYAHEAITALPSVGQSQRQAKQVQQQYSAYRTPQEVMRWQPPTPALLPVRNNHRHYVVSSTEPAAPAAAAADSMEASAETATQTASSSTAAAPFQIVYMDESLEAPPASTTTAAPQLRQSSRYALAREYYAFPVYTLGKLLASPSSKPQDCAEPPAPAAAASTWFILNSLYKGAHGNAAQRQRRQYYNSKYMLQPKS
ncbi:uncharacterized protein LOC108604978 [Drosophila busckii]|uniref:uncharacterized protein LOC108604978 n=1 Tax=Drosophila busckii TaxID=30019 RepID=UPI00083EA30F|nr:uncharacterized protein LOC108604978 [Drosophila busckii]